MLRNENVDIVIKSISTLLLGFLVFIPLEGPLFVFKSFEGDVVEVVKNKETCRGRYGHISYRYRIDMKIKQIGTRDVTIIGEEFEDVDIRKGQHISGRLSYQEGGRIVKQAYLDGKELVPYSEVIGYCIVVSVVICISLLAFLLYFRHYGKKTEL